MNALIDKFLPIIKESFEELFDDSEIVANVFKTKRKSMKLKKRVFEKYDSIYRKKTNE